MEFDFKNRLYKIRCESGMNQKEFAKKLGLPSSTLSRYESGLMKPSLEQGIRLAEILGVTVDWLAGHGDINNPERKEKNEL